MQLSFNQTLTRMKSAAIFLFCGIALWSCSSPQQEPATTMRNPADTSTNGFDANLVNNPRTADGDADLSVLGNMIFTDTLHDFGTIHEGELVEYNFKFKNTGKRNLIINSAMGSCGCTVPEYPKKPIKPGEEEYIKVKFDSKGRTGHQDKTVTVNTNGNPGTVYLFIKGEVK